MLKNKRPAEESEDEPKAKRQNAEDLSEGNQSEETLAIENSAKNFRIRCCGIEFHANHYLLISKSPYLKELINSLETDNDDSQENFLEIDRIQPETMQMVLNYIETGELPNLKDDEVNLLEVLLAGYVFQILDLIEYCCCCALPILTPSNVFNIWDFAKFYQIHCLLAVVINFIARHFALMKHESLYRIDTEEMKMLLLDPCLANELSDTLLEYVLKWIQIDSKKRSEDVSDLINAINTGSLSKIYLNFIQRHDPLIRNSPRIFEQIVKSVTKEKLKLFLVSQSEFQFYSVKQQQWSQIKKFPSFENEHMRASVYLDGFLYVFTGQNHIPFDLKSIFKYSIESGALVKVKSIDFEGHVSVAALNGFIYILCSKNYKKTPNVFYENVLYSYDVSENKLKLVESQFSENIVYYLVPADNCIFTYEEPEMDFSDSIKMYDLEDEYKHSYSHPEPSSQNQADFATSCLNEFYLIRHGEELDSISWKHDEPRPDESIELMKNRGFVFISDCDQRYTCKVKSREKSFFRLSNVTSEWGKYSTEKGPDDIRYVWKGPVSNHLLISYIYILSRDWRLYQYDPKDTKWEDLGMVPNRKSFCRSMPSWTMGC